MLFIFFRNGWTVLDPPFFHLNFKIGLSSFKNKNLMQFVWGWIESIDQFKGILYPVVLKSVTLLYLHLFIFSLLPFNKVWWSLHKILVPLWIYFYIHELLMPLQRILLKCFVSVCCWNINSVEFFFFKPENFLSFVNSYNLNTVSFRYFTQIVLWVMTVLLLPFKFSYSFINPFLLCYVKTSIVE